MQALFSFNGRIARLPFFGYSIVLLVMVLVPIAGVAMIVYQGNDVMFALGVVLLPGFIVVLWCGLALDVKRLHDIGLPGAHVIWIFAVNIGSGLLPAGSGVDALVSLASFGIAMWLLFAPGQPHDNEYGPDPHAKPDSRLADVF